MAQSPLRVKLKQVERIRWRIQQHSIAYSRLLKNVGSTSVHALPDFLIVGAMKCGTSSVYHYLSQHPGVIPPTQKEIHFFTSPNFHRLGERWYRSHFPTQAEMEKQSEALGYRVITGEASPAMIVQRYPENAANLVPSAKIIMILRNPVDRAYSHYQHSLRNWRREPLSFWDALQAEPQRTGENSGRDLWLNNGALRKMKRYSYIQRGKYIEQIKNWLNYFPREQLHIVNYQQLMHAPAQVYADLSAFCQLPPHNFSDFVVQHQGNYRDSMDKRCRDYLTQTFRPYNRRLFDLLGEDWGWPS